MNRKTTTVRLSHSVPYALVCCLLVAKALPSHAQRLEPVKRTPGHAELVAMAQEIVHGSKHFTDSWERPIFYPCRKRHLHWYIPYPDLWTESVVLEERLRIEWFWKHLSKSERKFWVPYIREIDAELDNFISITSQSNDEVLEEQEPDFFTRIDDIYEKGVYAYARATRTQPICDAPRGCSDSCSEFDFDVIIATSAKDVIAIQWIDAGTVWITVQRTGKEPEYHTYAPGTVMSVVPDGMYYYKLVFRDGRTTKRKLAPRILHKNKQVLLTGA